MEHASKTDDGVVERGPRFVREVRCAALFTRGSSLKNFLIKKRINWMYLLEISYTIVSTDVTDQIGVSRHCM